MPQFDKITFLMQIFWLILIFLILYLDILKFFLSEIATILKIRKKKIIFDTTLISDLSQKSYNIKLARKTFFFDFVENIRNSLLAVNETSSHWLNSSMYSLNNSNFKKSHSNFISRYFLLARK